ncbi:MAG: hypothetical protein QM687_09915 [Ferruginibacter sp.]
MDSIKVFIQTSLFGICIIISACSDDKTEINSEFVINGSWSKKGEKDGSNSIQIVKMNVKKDSTINPYINLSQEELLNKLEYDSTFLYTANVKIKDNENYREGKIYFDKENEFYWWSSGGNSKTKILGKLKAGSWYEFTRLKPYPYYIVFIDGTSAVHRFDINQVNY